MLIFIKLVLPQSAFQFATLVGSIPTFDSREIIRLTNEARSANQLAPLSANSYLDIAAEEKLNDMAVQEYFAQGKCLEIARYCAADVRATAELYERWEKFVKC